VLDMHVEVPFVPAAARKPKVLETYAEDTIVVVGQTRPKKRKRNSKKLTEQAESCEILAVPGNEDVEHHGVVSMSKPLGEKEKPEIVMEAGETSDEQDFDFSAVPNILDDDPDNEAQERNTKPKRLKSQDKTRKAKGPPFAAIRTYIG